MHSGRENLKGLPLPSMHKTTSTDPVERDFGDW